MQATINDTGKMITAKNFADLRRQLNAMLKVEGPQGLTATTNAGATIHVELYEGQDYIRLANGHAVNMAALALGALRSAKKAKSSRRNGRKGGRPRKAKS